VFLTAAKETAKRLLSITDCYIEASGSPNNKYLNNHFDVKFFAAFILKKSFSGLGAYCITGHKKSPKKQEAFL